MVPFQQFLESKRQKVCCFLTIKGTTYIQGLPIPIRQVQENGAVDEITHGNKYSKTKLSK